MMTMKIQSEKQAEKNQQKTSFLCCKLWLYLWRRDRILFPFLLLWIETQTFVLCVHQTSLMPHVSNFFFSRMHWVWRSRRRKVFPTLLVSRDTKMCTTCCILEYKKVDTFLCLRSEIVKFFWPQRKKKVFENKKSNPKWDVTECLNIHEVKRLQNFLCP